MSELLAGYFLLTLALFLIGVFCIVSQRNLIKIVIGIEVMGKAVILTFIMAGYYQNNTGGAQALAVTAILIDVVIVAMLLTLIVNIFRFTGGILTDRIAGFRGRI
jgi:NADH:ubiquinone oxidoreductase subunit K